MPNDASDTQINQLVDYAGWAIERENCTPICDHDMGFCAYNLKTDTPDTAPDWDGTPSVAKWNDVYTEAELAAVLRLHAAKLAKKYGIYEIAAELSFAADCIEDLADQIPVRRYEPVAGITAGVEPLEYRAVPYSDPDEE